MPEKTKIIMTLLQTQMNRSDHISAALSLLGHQARLPLEERLGALRGEPGAENDADSVNEGLEKTLEGAGKDQNYHDPTLNADK